MSRLTPSMPANLAQNLDQQSRSANSTPRLSQTKQEGMYGSELPQLPPIDISGNRPSEQSPSDISLSSSQYSQPSGVEEYLKDDKLPSINETTAPIQQVTSQPARNDPYNTYTSSRAGPQTTRTDPYSTNTTTRNDPYSSYNASTSQLFSPPQAPFVEQARPSSRPGSSQGKAQFPKPPPMVDYSKATDLSDTSSRGRQSYQQPYSGDAPRLSNAPPQDEFKYPQQPARGRSPQPQPSRPFSQDMTNPARQDSPRPHRGSGTYVQPGTQPDFIDMPEGLVQPFNDFILNDPLQPPVRLTDSPGRQSPRIPVSTSNPIIASAAMVTPPSLIPQSDYEWGNEIESQRETAQRTADPDIALTWAEKVYMYVSISLEEIRREQEKSAGNVAVPSRSSTPSYERGLRDDCIRIVEKFAKMQIPKAVVQIIWAELMVDLYAWYLV